MTEHKRMSVKELQKLYKNSGELRKEHRDWAGCEPLDIVFFHDAMSHLDEETEARKKAEARVTELEASLQKISAIRDGIIGAQNVNWSEHIYPLVAALDKVGFKGAGYEIARKNVGTLLEQIAELEAEVAELDAELESRADEAKEDY